MSKYRVRYHFKVKNADQWAGLNNLSLSDDAKEIFKFAKVEDCTLIIEGLVDVSTESITEAFCEVSREVRSSAGGYDDSIVIADYIRYDGGYSGYICKVGDIADMGTTLSREMASTDIRDARVWLAEREKIAGTSNNSAPVQNTAPQTAPQATPQVAPQAAPASEAPKNNVQTAAPSQPQVAAWSVEKGLEVRHDVFALANLEEIKVIAKENMARMYSVFGKGQVNFGLSVMATFKAVASKGRAFNEQEKIFVKDVFAGFPEDKREALLSGVEKEFSEDDAKMLEECLAQLPFIAPSVFDLAFCFAYADGFADVDDEKSLNKLANLVATPMRVTLGALQARTAGAVPPVDYMKKVSGIEGTLLARITGKDAFRSKASDEEIETRIINLLKDGKQYSIKGLRLADKLLENLMPRRLNVVVHNLLQRGDMSKVFLGDDNYYRSGKALYEYAVNACENAKTVEDFAKLVSSFLALDDYKDSAEYAKECLDSLNSLKYERAIKLMAEAKSFSEMRKAAEEFGELGEYKQAKELFAICSRRADDMFKAYTYADAKTKMVAAKTSAEVIAIRDAFVSLGEYRDASQLADDCNKKIEPLVENEAKAAVYQKALGMINEKDIATFFAAAKELETISGWRDADVKAKAIRVKAEKINAENEKKRIKKSNKGKKLVLWSSIGGSAAVILIAAIVLTFTLFIPMSKQNKAEKLVAEGKYSEAREIYLEISDFEDSMMHASVMDAIKKIQDGSIEEGIGIILTNGVPVELTYDTDGGKLTTLNLGYKLSTVTGSVSDVANEALKVRLDSKAQFEGLNLPKKIAYNFVKWNASEISYSPEEGSRCVKLTLKAEWTAIEYKIDYVLVGGSISETVVTKYNVESETFTIEKPTREGYTFIGWTALDTPTAAVEFTIPKGSYGDKQLTAHWEANKYTVTLDPSDGKFEDGTTVAKTLEVTYDANYSLPKCTRDGYTFAGWTDGVVVYDSQTAWKKVGNITLTPKWTVAKYAITYDLGGGTVSSANQTQYDINSADITLNNPTRVGYDFVGWTNDKDGSTTPVMTAVIKQGSYGDVKYTANWKAKEYTVSFDVNGGYFNKHSMKVEYGKSYSLGEASKTGYSFVGWKSDNTSNYTVQNGKFVFTGDVELYAEWKANTYTITFVSNGGSTISPSQKTVTYGQTVTFPTAPTRSGYDFMGWFDGEDEYYDGATWYTAHNVTLKATWKKRGE